MTTREEFENYRVLRHDDGSLWELGRGAMGVTYKALDADLHCEVALKVIQPGILGSDEAGQRFLREARSLARLRHPNIATIFRLGRTEEGGYFFAMEFCEGRTLQQMVEQQGPLEAAVALEVVAQVAGALMQAEDHRLVHRDLKPANLILTHRRDEGMVVKVIDFGLAKNYGAGDGQASAWASLSSAGFIGTAHFASPEQLEEQEIDTRADIYSLGATLWFLLTGKPVFEGSLARVMNQHLSSPAPVDTLRGRVPACVRSLLGGMLEKDRGRRPATALDLRRAVRDCQRALAEGTGEREESAGPRLTAATRFRLLEEKPRGRAGPLFRAVDTAARGEPAAVRVLDKALVGDRTAFEAFAAEVEKVRANSHPAFLRVQPLAAGPDGNPWLVSEWVTGFTLLGLLQARRMLGLRETLSLLGPLAGALDHAARHGLSRLELDKHQVFFHFPAETIEDAAGFVGMPSAEWPAFALKVNALGLAGEQAGPGAQPLAATATMLPGVTALCSGPDPAVPRDYPRELAALTYELLGGANPAQARIQEGGRFVPLARLTEGGNTVLHWAIACAPGAGYATAAEFFEALEAHAGYESAATWAARPTPAPNAQAANAARGSRGKIPAVAAVVLGLAVLGGATYFVGTAARHRQPSPQASSMPSTAGSAVRALPQPSAGPPPARRPAPTPPPVDSFLEALLALPSSDARLALLKSHRESLTEDYLASISIQAHDLVEAGQVEAAVLRLGIVIEAAEVAGEHTRRGLACVSRGDIYRDAGRITEAIQDFTTAREMAARAPDNETLPAAAATGLGLAYIERGNLHLTHGEWEEALKDFLAAREQEEEGYTDAIKPGALRGVGIASLKLGRWPEAETAFRAEIPLETEGADKKVLADAWNNLGRACMGQNKYPEALTLLQKGKSIAEEIPYAAGVHQAQEDITACLRSMGGLAPAPPAPDPAKLAEHNARSFPHAGLPWTNLIGMRFAPVPGLGVLFSIWETRVQDFELFAAETHYDAGDGMVTLAADGWKPRGGTWRQPGFIQGPAFPVVGIDWDTANAFCAWLTAKERGRGLLGPRQCYRLPSDVEWSLAAGLAGERGATPRERDGRVRGIYPWGGQWPPPARAGNFRGQESRIGQEPAKWAMLAGYNDGFARTAPVGSFAPNAFGLYDLSGNVWEWCADLYTPEKPDRVTRGGSWRNDAPVDLLTSKRESNSPDSQDCILGFRCVLAFEDRSP